MTIAAWGGHKYGGQRTADSGQRTADGGRLIGKEK
jgi:hypothetical protein